MQSFAIFEGDFVGTWCCIQSFPENEKLVRDIQHFHLYPKLNLEIISQAGKEPEGHSTQNRTL